MAFLDVSEICNRSMEKTKVTIVIVPVPCQSQLNQLLGVASLLSSHDLPVHFLGSAAHSRNPTSKITFHNLPTPPIADSGKLMEPPMSAYGSLRRPIAAFVQETSTTTEKLVLIYDRLIAETVTDAVSVPNVESYAFNCLSAFNTFYILWETLGKPIAFPGEPNCRNEISITDFYPESVLHFISSKPDHFKNRAGDLHNTIRLIEGKYIDLLAKEELRGKRQQWAISPLLSLSVEHDRKAQHECLEWLDKQAPESVVYVSFGRSVTLSGDEVLEIASGLERSKHGFLWVLREDDRADISSRKSRKIELPEGFEERNRDKGIIVRGLVPQLEILGHKSVGGFMSHCGWNSCVESLSMGVPILAWPMHSDQPMNAIFMTDVLRVGIMVREWTKVWEVVKASVIENVVGRMMASEEGEEVRRRAAEMREALGKATEEGGECWRELDGFITHINR